MLIQEMGLFQDTFQDFMKQRITNQDVRDTIFLYAPKDEKKSAIFAAACEEYETDPNSKIFDGFLPTINDIEKFFA